MLHTHQKLKKSLSSVPDDGSVPDTTHFDSYFPSDLQNELADSLDGHDSDDLSQINHSGITLHKNIIPDGNHVDLPALIISSSTDSYDDQELDSPHPTNVQESPNRVRFRSRVRITSGFNRHRHKQHQNQSGIDYLSFSPASSVSGSPSSSISAPLRTHTDEQIGKPGWGTLGQRVSMFARGNMERRKLREQREQLSSPRKFRGDVPVIPYANTAGVNEQTPLLLSPPSRHRASNAIDHRDSDSAREDEASQISREVEMVFGSWPGRLANYHWWWWQMEPIICCRCLSDPDDEGQ